MPNRAACHHFIRSARVCSCMMSAGVGAEAACELLLCCASAPGSPSMASDAPVPLSMLRRENFWFITQLPREIPDLGPSKTQQSYQLKYRFHYVICRRIPPCDTPV